MPWLRLDALNLNIIWAYVPLAKMAQPTSAWAWMVGALNIPISFGWAAGDVSLAGPSLPLFSDCLVELMFFFQLTFKLPSQT
jgi:hypothetical protein